MDKDFSNQSMLDVFVYETTQNIEQLEEAILTGEKASCFTQETINEIFRVMHTIKGSASMMLFDNIASLSHGMEDLFYYIRENNPENMDCALLSDLVLEGLDFIKLEIEKMKNADALDGDPSGLIEKIKSFLKTLQEEKGESDTTESKELPPGIQQFYPPPCKNSDTEGRKTYEANVFFEDGCEMENVRAFIIAHNLKEITEEFCYYPEDIIDNPDSMLEIRKNGFKVILRTDISLNELNDFFTRFSCIRDVELHECQDGQTTMPAKFRQTALQGSPVKASMPQHQEHEEQIQIENHNSRQIISVDVVKLDKLMDLMGEMVISEAMVTQNPDLKKLRLNSFEKAARQLGKITGEMQDMIMSIRMVPLTASFHKMHRVVRDMCRKLGKEVELTLAGEGTEVDKNIIEHISDPLMHLVRNSIDHGIEMPDMRVAAGKPKTGQLTLEARDAGSDVLIIVKDDGSGLDREKIFQKAVEHGLISKPEKELSDKEIYNLLFLPGFSTNEQVTEFSGRGVGMDVVVKNLEAIGGTVSIDSTRGLGTTITMKIPLTLAIIDGMNIRVGKAKYTLPTTSIRETFQVKAEAVIKDPEGNEMIMVRGECYPVLRIHEIFNVETRVTDLTRGIMLMIEQDDKCAGLFADELLGQNQVVVKTLPSYMKNFKRVEELAGCTLLGDGSISLILNIGGLLSIKRG